MPYAYKCPHCGHTNHYQQQLLNKQWFHCHSCLKDFQITSNAEPLSMPNPFDDCFHPSIPEGSAKTSTHYQVGDKQPIEIMQDTMPRDELIGFLRGNVIKYSLRLGHKDDPKREAGKIEQYAKWLRIVLEGSRIDPRN